LGCFRVLVSCGFFLKCVENASEESCDDDGVYVILQNQRWGNHLNKVKQALFSWSNMGKALNEEAVQAVSEMDSLLNKLRGMFLGLECMLE
jgi:hypothetical protein